MTFCGSVVNIRKTELGTVRNTSPLVSTYNNNASLQDAYRPRQWQWRLSVYRQTPPPWTDNPRQTPPPPGRHPLPRVDPSTPGQTSSSIPHPLNHTCPLLCHTACPTMNRETPVKSLPSPIVRMRSVIMIQLERSMACRKC